MSWQVATAVGARTAAVRTPQTTGEPRSGIWEEFGKFSKEDTDAVYASRTDDTAMDLAGHLHVPERGVFASTNGPASSEDIGGVGGVNNSG